MFLALSLNLGVSLLSNCNANNSLAIPFPLKLDVFYLLLHNIYAPHQCFLMSNLYIHLIYDIILKHYTTLLPKNQNILKNGK